VGSFENLYYIKHFKLRICFLEGPEDDSVRIETCCPSTIINIIKLCCVWLILHCIFTYVLNISGWQTLKLKWCHDKFWCIISMQNVKKTIVPSQKLNTRVNRKAYSPSYKKKKLLICVCHTGDFITSFWTESRDFGVGILSLHFWLSTFVFLQEASRWNVFITLQGNLRLLCPLSKYITFLHYKHTGNVCIT